MFFLRPILTYADEAHHAVAPILKRVIQYYNTDFTVGLTATDQRPDKKKLYLMVIKHLLDKMNSFFLNCEYYGAAEPPVRCGESHLSGLTEPPQFVY